MLLTDRSGVEVLDRRPRLAGILTITDLRRDLPDRDIRERDRR